MGPRGVLPKLALELGIREYQWTVSSPLMQFGFGPPPHPRITLADRLGHFSLGLFRACPLM